METIRTYWDHTTKPSRFVVYNGDRVISDGPYEEGMQIFRAALKEQQAQNQLAKESEPHKTTHMNTIEINGETYIKASESKGLDIGEVRIIVADRGWVFVGNCTDNEDGSVIIKNAKNIRRWGTTKGLGELATGPTKDTVADDYGTVRTTPIVTIAVERGW